MSNFSLENLQTLLGYKFSNIGLLEKAITHRSYGKDNNERLEFLGDSVLNCVVAQMLFKRFSHLNEGELSRLRSNLVNQDSLFAIANGLSLGQYLKMGTGEKKSNGHSKPSILSDAVEAVFGATFLDGGFEAISFVISRLYDPIISDVDGNIFLKKDSKTALQEKLQGKGLNPPHYTVDKVEGFAHQQTFKVICKIPEMNIISSGEGASRRAAEKDAARLALEIVGE